MKDLSSEFIFVASRSGGKGGQNVNKVSTKVSLRFHIQNSLLLTDEEKLTISEKLMARISLEGFIQVTSQTERSQLGNKEKSIARFYQIIEKALAKPKPRRATKPSKASKEVRLQSKKKLSEKKQNRSNSNVE